MNQRKEKHQNLMARGILNLAAGLMAMIILAIGSADLATGATTPAPAWGVTSIATPTNFAPGDPAVDYSYDVRVANVGGAPTDGSPVQITDKLPAGLEVTDVDFRLYYPGKSASDNPVEFGWSAANPEWELCEEGEADGSPTITCTIPEEFPPSLVAAFPTSETSPSLLYPGQEVRLSVHVAVPTGTPEQTIENEVVVTGGGAPTRSEAVANRIDSEPAGQGLHYFRVDVTDAAGQTVTQAGSHPFQYTTSFAVNTRPAPPGNNIEFVPAGGDVKDIPVALPPGFVGNPTAVAKCTAEEFNEIVKVDQGLAFYFTNECPAESVVGYLRLQQIEGNPGMMPVPLFNLVPPRGMPAQLGFQILGLPFFINTEVRVDQGHRVVAALRNTSQAKRVTAASVTIWGVPGDSTHDPVRGACLSAVPETSPYSTGSCSGDPQEKPFLRLPTSCTSPLEFSMSYDTWTTPGSFISKTTDSGGIPTGCELLQFDPNLEARPTTDVADAPSGLHVDLHIPQREEAEELATADLRKAVVQLPPGLVINPSGANGLAGCSSEQVGLQQKSPLIFSNSPTACPDASRIGKVEVDTPLIDHPLPGSVYVAQPFDNPFESLLAIYVTVSDPISGVVVKLPGKIEPDAATGRLTAVFDDAPQLPFEDFKLDFFSGDRAPLRTSALCGSYGTTSVMTPWSAPASGPPATPSDVYAISRAPHGNLCSYTKAEMPHRPAFEAGTLDPRAKAFSPFVVNLRREDGSQEFDSIDVSLPPGLVAKLAGVPYCGEEALQSASVRSGRDEQATPSCPLASELGSARVGAGAGPAPYYAGGKVYLAGPYRGAPLSLAVVTPAVAGPYDLGTVVVRTALQVNPLTAQISAISDPLPRILHGIPLDLRLISLRIDRPDFTLNPTSCDEASVRAEVRSVFDLVSSLRERFQVGGCDRLGFAPKLSLKLSGGTKRSDYPSLRAVLKTRKGDANIGRVSVALPHSEFLAQEHIGSICTRVQFAADNCPKASIYGFARATTPLLGRPLKGPVYLRANGGERKLPDLVAALRGQIDIELVGYIDSRNGGMRTTFASAPDAPVTKFVLNMKGGEKGLLANSRDICAAPARADVVMRGHNGKRTSSRPFLRAKCAKKERGGRHEPR